VETMDAARTKEAKTLKVVIAELLSRVG
jgi:hypothetical protein